MEHRTRASAHITSPSSTAPTPTLRLPFQICILEKFGINIERSGISWFSSLNFVVGHDKANAPYQLNTAQPTLKLTLNTVLGSRSWWVEVILMGHNHGDDTGAAEKTTAQISYEGNFCGRLRVQPIHIFKCYWPTAPSE